GNYRSGPSAATPSAQGRRWTPWSPCLSRGGDPGRTARALFRPWIAGSSPAMTWKKTLARDFPRRFDFASFLVLRVLQRDAHFGKLVADAVGLFKVFMFPSGVASLNQRSDLHVRRALINILSQ